MKDDVIVRFKQLKNQNPLLGNVILFAQVAQEFNLTEKQIKKYLPKLCKKDFDYFNEREVIDYVLP